MGKDTKVIVGALNRYKKQAKVRKAVSVFKK